MRQNCARSIPIAPAFSLTCTMANYPELQLPAAWKPLFRKMDAAGWELETTLPQADWAIRPLLVYSNSAGGKRYLSFLNEPIWCGNTRQAAGMTIVALSRELPSDRSEAEVHALPLVGDWEDQLSEWLAEGL